MTIFAKIAGSRGHLFAMFMHQQAGGAWTDTPEQGFVTTDCDEPEVWAHLPELSEADAREVAEHCFYSGADLTVAARVFAERGAEALYDYADTQNCYGMPGAPQMSEEQLKWVGSGLTPTPTIQLGA